MSGIALPKKDNDLIEVLKNNESESQGACNIAKTRWLLTMRYMQGDRNFINTNWSDGNITVNYYEGDDSEFKFEGLLPYYKTEMGRFMQMDLSPAVRRRGEGLDGLKNRSIAQIILDDRMSKEQAESFKADLLPLFLQTGHLGIGAFADKDTPPHLEVIPGWELRSVPAEPVVVNSVEGLMRVRHVTKEWLQSKGLYQSSKDSDYEWVELPVGKRPDSGGAGTLSGSLNASPPYGVGGGRAASSYEGRRQFWTPVIECWMRTENNKLREYAAIAGKVKIGRYDVAETKGVPMPVNIARYLTVSGFYGRGFAEQLVNLNSEAEVMLDQLFQNVENWDEYGLLCLSTNMGLSVDEVLEKKNGPRVLMYNPDLYNPSTQPFQLTPVNSGQTPLKIAQTCLELIGHQSSQSEILSGEAPGRVDSAQGLGLLMETANMPLSDATASLSQAVSNSYEALLWLSKQNWGERHAVELSLRDDSLVGIKYNPQTGQVELEKDAIPHPDEVSITVGTRSPRSPSQIRADLDDQLAKGIITPREYRIKARLEDLDLPVGNEQEWHNYRRAIVNNLILYGDGETPGAVRVAEHDMHEVHLSVLTAFMARPEFFLASDEVRAAFENHLIERQEALGEYPKNIPTPEDAAMEQIMQMKSGGLRTAG